MTRLRPVLDDLTYADLLSQAVGRIPAVAPQWTDFNAADPGITLLELFAWFAEMLVYQADQLPADRTDAFLRLLNGPDWTRTGDLDTAVAETLTALSSPWRAATADDVVDLLTRVWPEGTGDGRPLRRVHCLPGRDLSQDGGTDRPAPGHLSIVVVPVPAEGDAALPQAPPELCAAVLAWLEPRRLLGVRHVVVGPSYVPVTVTARLVLREDYAPTAVARSGVLTDAAIAHETGRLAAAAVTAHLDPLHGGADRAGWPFGRPVYASELYALLDGQPGVDYVDGLAFPGSPADRQIVVDGEVTGIRLAPHELVAVTLVDDAGQPGQLTVTWPREVGAS